MVSELTLFLYLGIFMVTAYDMENIQTLKYIGNRYIQQQAGIKSVERQAEGETSM